MIIAIDGPAGSGKSTTARLVAEKLGFWYLDTGAMYRAATYAFLDRKIEMTESGAEDLFEVLDIGVYPGLHETRVTVDSEDVTDRIRSPAVNRNVSAVSALHNVRKHLVEKQRKAAHSKLAVKGIVLDGRDIGTYVFPDADLKVFMTASVDERTRRRYEEERAKSAVDVVYDEVRASIAERDRIDSTRTLAPLRQADDAIVLDTTGLEIEEQVDRVIALARERSR